MATIQHEQRAGFNLVELLVAIVVLSIVVTMMASIFRGSQSALTQGTAQNDVETAGRVALGILTRDLQAAVADSVLTFNMRDARTNSGSYGFVNSEVSFITFQENPTATNRAARMIMYWVQPIGDAPERFELVRACRPADTVLWNCYTNPSWFEDASLGFGRPVSPDMVGAVARNVAGLRLTTPETGFLEYSSDTQSNRLPAYVDIYLELLGEPEARRIADMKARGLDCTDSVERSARRFTTRVHFYNRDGYRMP